MKVLTTIAQVRAERARGGPLAFVPTMGALHDGHLSLVAAARTKAPVTAVSIFVNPTQFGRAEDLSKYPRPIDDDLAKCKAAGVDWVFHPSADEMYPPTAADVTIALPLLDAVLEGKHRAGHFSGVCQVVAKLFNIVQPTVACFGQKDFQQLRVLSALVESLNWPVEVVACPTLRDADGLAMSSRNQYLSEADRQRALAIPRSLSAAVELARAGEQRASRLVTAVQAALLAQHLHVDYVAAVDPRTLRPVEALASPAVLAVAARVGTTRLIDNVTVGG